jgi:hypothetical protein
MDAADEFLTSKLQEDENAQGQLEALLALKTQGLDDPDIDMFLAVSSGVTPLLKSALERGGNPGLGIGSLMRRYQASSAES